MIRSTPRVVCPACDLSSDQPASKMRLKQAMLCPGCKALFVSPRQPLTLDPDAAVGCSEYLDQQLKNP
ncbi:YnfU family zinc-binding protein [Erwinia sp. STN24]|uniref:YnfU family zinc-binding protein n=1 Tax=Erwinia sp. STN24 TaxID=3233996 RepID=UPI003521BF78